MTTPNFPSFEPTFRLLDGTALNVELIDPLNGLLNGTLPFNVISVTGGIAVGGNLTVVGGTVIDGSDTIVGNNTIDGNQTIIGSESIGGNATITGGLAQTWDAVFAGNVTVTGTRVQTGNETLSGTLAVVGASTYTGIRSGSCDGAVTAAGSTRTDAFALTKELNYISSAASGTGVILPALSVDEVITVFNAGASVVQVYAPGSVSIDGTAGSTGVALTNTKRCQYFGRATNDYRSAQLGLVSA